MTLFLGKTVLFNFVFSRRYVAKMTGKSVFSDKITGKKGGLFCRRLFFEKPFFPKNTTHNVQPYSISKKDYSKWVLFPSSLRPSNKEACGLLFDTEFWSCLGVVHWVHLGQGRTPNETHRYILNRTSAAKYRLVVARRREVYRRHG